MNRRKAVGVLGSLVVASAWGRRVLAQPVCTLTPEQIEGPFYLDQARIREDISEGKPGVPLRLALRVLNASASCAPIPRAAVDVWQCDALGIYSAYEGAGIAPRHVEPAEHKTALRGPGAAASARRPRVRPEIFAQQVLIHSGFHVSRDVRSGERGRFCGALQLRAHLAARSPTKVRKLSQVLALPRGQPLKREGTRQRHPVLLAFYA